MFSLRNLRAIRGGLVILGVVVLIATAGVTAWPRVTAALLTSDLTYRTATSGATTRDLQSSVEAATETPITGSEFGVPTLRPTWDGMPAALTRAHVAMGAALRDVTGPGRYVGRNDGAQGTGIQASGSPHAPVNSVFNLAIEANPRLQSDARLVSGSWPAQDNDVPSDTPLQLVMTKAAARLLNWKVGETQTFGLTDGAQQTVVLVGLLEPRDPSTDYWQLDPSRAHSSFVSSPDGDLKSYHGVVWMNAASWTSVGLQFAGERIQSWYPVSSGRLTVPQLPALSGALQKFLANPHPAGKGTPQVQLRFSTNLANVLSDFASRAGPAVDLLAVIGTGPLGTGLAVLLLGVILLVDRRESALSLVMSRGGSRRRVRWMVALETAVASVPAAVIVGAIAVRLTVGPIDSFTIAAIASCAVLPPVAAAIRAGTPAQKPTRAGLVSRGRWRWIVEILLIALAALGVVLLTQRGLSDDGSAGADPLLTLTPLLVAAAACVIVLRFFPFALAWLGRVLRPTRGVVGYVGWATSARGRPRFIPVFAVVAGVSVAVFSLTVLTTERAGIENAALSQIGADISVRGPVSPDVERKLRALPSVVHAASIISAGGISMTGVSDNVALYTADPRELALVQGALPPSLQLFATLGTTVHGRTVTIAGGFQQHPPRVSTIQAQSPVPISVHEVGGHAGKFIGAVPWLMIATSAIPPSAELPHQTSAMLLALRPGVNPNAARAEVVRIAGSGATVTVTPTVVDQLRAAPIVSGMEYLTVAALALSALMCVIALILTLVMNTDERIRLLARLRVLGFTRRQSTGLISWELGPMSVLGVIAGVIVGVVLPIVILASVNLAGFTGSDTRPLLTIDPALVAATVVAFLLAATIATVVAIVIARRASPATILRATGED